MTSSDVKALRALVGATCITETLGQSSLQETTAQHFKRTITAKDGPNLRRKDSTSVFETGLRSNTHVSSTFLEDSVDA
jgi:hypothetical protein